MSEWPVKRLDDLCEGIFDCPHSTPKLTAEGPYVVRTQDIITGVFVASSAAHVSEDTYQARTRRAMPQRGDLLYSREGTYFGIAAEVPTGVKVCLGQRMVLIRPNQALLDFRFLRYWLNSPAMASYISGFRDGSVAERLNLPTIRALPIQVPSMPEQAAMASVLSALDDKIAVNEKIASAADELCATVLKEVIADDDDVSDAMLADMASINARKVTPSPGGNLRYIDISSVGEGKIDWPEAVSWDGAPGRARRGVMPGDTIWSTVRPNRRSHALVLDDDPELVVSTGFAVLTPIKVGPAYLYEVTRRDEFVQYLESVAEGSAYPAVRAERFGQALIPLLSPERIEGFEARAMPVRQRAHVAQVESRDLAKIRDMLLPKLMSGEIRVREAEKIVEGVT